MFERPVIILGEGARGADLSRLLEWRVPVLTSWQACDILDNNHPSYFGRPGVWGQRCANKVLHNADYVISIGCRLSVMTVGHGGIRDDQSLDMIDIDSQELRRLPKARRILCDAIDYIRAMEKPQGESPVWFEQCEHWRARHPWYEPAHAQAKELTSYQIVHALEPHLRPDEVIVTDMGVALCAAFQLLRVKPPQRLMTSGGLGEMGCGLPAAIGASFVRNKGEVICLHCDGGMMMNLQELQTIVHHNLPVKIIVFNNDGYLMLKATQKNLGLPYAGVNAKSGVSVPSFSALAKAFGMAAAEVRTWGDWSLCLPWMLEAKEPVLIEVFTDPEQKFIPKVEPWIEVGGEKRRPTFEEMSP